MYLSFNTVISLPQDVTFTDDGLYDSVADYSYKLNETGSAIIRELLDGANVGQVCANLAKKYEKHRKDIVNDVFGRFLNCSTKRR